VQISVYQISSELLLHSAPSCFKWIKKQADTRDSVLHCGPAVWIRITGFPQSLYANAFHLHVRSGNASHPCRNFVSRPMGADRGKGGEASQCPPPEEMKIKKKKHSVK
jgi:hypothetical protein